MWPSRQFPADLVTFTKEILNGKLYFFVQSVLMNALSRKHFFRIFYLVFLANIIGHLNPIRVPLKWK